MAKGSASSVDDAKRLFQIRNHADFHREIAPDLGGIDIDLHQPGRREVERVFPLPRTAVRLRKARTKRQHPVGSLALFVDETRAPEAGHAEHQWMVVRKRALSHQCVGNGE